ncbi:MAG: divergent PAP2 family protein [Eubacteriales bacterium]
MKLIQLIQNAPLISAAIAWFFAELIKMIIVCIKDRTWKAFSLANFVASGGMPSSHAATVCALAASIAMIQGGFDSPQFAIAAVLAMIVMYDAAGVRRETGEQAKALNMILADMFSPNHEFRTKAFKELVGHTPSQVVMGALVGVAVGVVYPLLVA